MAENIEEENNPQEEATPTLAEVLRKAMQANALEMRVSVPAKVVKYYKDKAAVDVKPDFHQKYRDGKIEEAPIIYNVPVAFMRAGSAFISMPLKKGHSVTLFFSDRSLEKWKTSGSEGHPEDTRCHHISDAVAYPGVYPFSNTVKINNDDDIIISNTGKKNRLEIRIKPNGHIQILNGSDELIKTMDDWFQVMREAVIYTCNGPQTLKHTKLVSTHNRLKTFREK